MNISGFILVLIAVFLIYKIHTDPIIGQSGGAQTKVEAYLQQDPYYARQYRELDNVDNVLNRPQEPGKEVTQNLVASNVYTHQQAELCEPVKTYIDFSDMDIVKKETPEETRILVENRQPYFLDEALIIDNYGEQFYWDWRYPKQPISVKFVTDPEGYVRDHPNVYPSYIIKSRNLKNLKPNDPK